MRIPCKFLYDLSYQVGFSGVLVYASAFLAHHLRNDNFSARFIEEGRLLLFSWDKFSFHSRPNIANSSQAVQGNMLEDHSGERVRIISQNNVTFIYCSPGIFFITVT